MGISITGIIGTTGITSCIGAGDEAAVAGGEAGGGVVEGGGTVVVLHISSSFSCSPLLNPVQKSASKWKGGNYTDLQENIFFSYCNREISPPGSHKMTLLN